MALTPEEVRRMEEQADLSDRFNKAADRYVAGNNPGLRAAEREQVLRQREGDVFADARNRRLNSVMDIALRDPGRYAPSVHRAAVEWDRQNQAAGLRDHELAVADKGIEQERVKAWGMANQGGVAAGIKAGVERDANRSQHGYFDENGNYVPGSTVHAAEATGLSREEIARINNEGRWNVATANNETRKTIAEGNNQTKTQIAEKNNQTRTDIAGQNNQTRKEVGAGHDQARRDAAGAQQQRADRNAASRVDQDVMQGKYLMSGMTPEKWKAMSEEERTAFRNSVGVGQGTGGNQPPARRSWRERLGAGAQQ